jgi:uncharacterized membrane protein YoaK (UPF0700 family)
VSSPRPAPGPEPAPLLAALLALTAISGLVDAVSYLGLGHVFAANMTGNVVVLGFAFARTPGFSIPATLTSLVAFLAGGVVAGRVTGRLRGRAPLLTTTLAVESVLLGVVTLIVWLGPGGTAVRLVAVAILALAMGMRNVNIRALGVGDLNTTVLTSILAALAAESRLAGGRNRDAGRRIGSVLAMIAGAAAGALLVLHVSAALPLLAACVAEAGMAVAFRVAGPGATAAR